MNLIETISATQILIGAAIMLLSIAISLKIKQDVSANLRLRWIITLSLMLFFFFGYNLFVIILILGIPFPLEIVTGTVFLGGAVFVYLVMKLTQITLQDITKKDKDIQIYADGLTKRTIELEREITERIRTEEALRRSEEQYRSLVESTDDSIYVVDREYKYIFMNKKHMTRMNVSDNDYIGKKYSEFHSPTETNWFVEKTNYVFDKGESIHYEHKSLKDESYYLLTLSPIKNEDGTVIAVTIISKDITEYKILEEKLRDLSLTDQLTGIYNRRGFFTLVEQLLKQCNREKKGIYMLYADIDNLKGINDTFGHQEGDSALIETANILKNNYRESDIIARIGGDEFVVIPIGTTGDNIDKLMSRLKENVEVYNSGRVREYKLSLSCGITYYDPEHPCSADELLGQGDKKMYEQKKSNKKS